MADSNHYDWHGTNCVHCGQHDSTRQYALRFTRGGTDEFRLPLCEVCLDALLSEPAVERV